MRAAVIARAGGPEVLEIQERPTPRPGSNELLIRVRASALNRADLLQREGHYPAPAGSPADVPGMEFAGEVAAAGGHVTTYREGDRVFGIVGGGGNAEYLTTDADCVARVPENLSWTDAAAVPEAFITAHDALVTQAGVKAGEIVLIHAVGSGVGLAGAQLAHAFGATAYGTARTAAKIDRAKALGLADGITVADDVDVIAAPIAEWTNGRGIDVTLDLVGGSYVAASVRAAAAHGRIILIGTVAGRTASLPLGVVLGKRLVLRGTVLRSRTLEEKRLATAAFARDVVPLLASGAVKPVVDTVLPLEEIRAAHERLASNATFGKVVLRVD